MTKTEFEGLKIGDRVKAGYSARPRSVTYVYDDPSGARIVSLSAIQGCTKSITNLSYGDPDHYVNWRLDRAQAKDVKPMTVGFLLAALLAWYEAAKPAEPESKNYDLMQYRPKPRRW